MEAYERMTWKLQLVTTMDIRRNRSLLFPVVGDVLAGAGQIVPGRVEHLELLVPEVVVHADVVLDPLDVGGPGGQPDRVGADEGHPRCHDDKQRLDAQVMLQGFLVQPLKIDRP